MTSGDFNISDPFMLQGMRDTAPHSNPYHTYSQVYSPRRLKELFKWCEYLFFNSAHIYAALRKFGEYPITEVRYDTTNDALRARHKNLLEKVIHVRELLIEMTLDKYVYGNAFLSMYQPFIRYLKCTRCSALTNIQNLDYKYAYSSIKFTYKCPACNRETIATLDQVQDRKLALNKRINFIRWDPKHMNIDYNPLTGSSTFYYTLPQSLIDSVQKGHKFLIDSMPVGFLKAIKERKDFKFARDAVFHMKVGGPAGVNPQWGLPPLLSTLQLFHYAAILRKANECVSLAALVETSAGLVCADDVNVGDLVRTHTGNWQSVTDKKYRDAREDEVGIRITTSGARGLGQVFSPQHPIMVVKAVKENEPLADAGSKRYSRGRQPPGRILEHPHLYEEAYCPARQIQVGDYALTPRRLPAEEQVVDVAKYTGLVATDDYVYGMCTEETAEAFEKVERGEYVEHDNAGRVAKRTLKVGNEPKRFPAKMPMTPDFAYILGWYAGDGSCNQRNVLFSLGMDDDAEPLKDAIKSVFNIDSCSNTNKQGNLNTITLGNTIVRKLVKGMIPGTSRHKQAPMEVLNGPDAVKIAYLKGLWEADGCTRVEETQSVLATSSLNQAYDAYRMLLHLGCIPHLGTRKTEASSILESGVARVIPGGTHHQVTVSGGSTRRFLALCRGEAAEEIFTGKSGFFWKDYFATRIAEVAEVEEEQYVDFKVENDETFVSVGICSHNCIALDHLVPFRIVHPAQQSGNADPVTTISLTEWKTQLKDHFKKWRSDPLHMMFAPIPIGMTQIGGQGRALLTLGEVQEAEKNIVAALGIPLEFLYGGLTKSGMEATLRLIENQLETHVNDLNDCLQWVGDNCAKFLGYAKVEVELAPFRIIDDRHQQQVTLQLYHAGQQMGRKIISDQTMAESINIDLVQEEDRIAQEELDAVRRNSELQLKIRALQDNMASQIQAEAQQMQSGAPYDQRVIIGHADQVVEQWQQMPAGSRRSAMDSLLKEDLVLYSVAMYRWGQMSRRGQEGGE